MAYDEGTDNAQVLLRTVRLTFDVSGRSRRTEVVYWWFATAIASAVINFGLSTLLSWKGGVIVNALVNAIFSIPMFALFGRRLHDQGRSGWWATLFPASIVLSLPGAVRWMIADPEQLLVRQQDGFHPLQWVAGIASVVMLVLALLPGTSGPNRYGVDPRQSEEGDS